MSSWIIIGGLVTLNPIVFLLGVVLLPVEVLFHLTQEDKDRKKREKESK